MAMFVLAVASPLIRSPDHGHLTPFRDVSERYPVRLRDDLSHMRTLQYYGTTH
jgi:hypothetical protein